MYHKGQNSDCSGCKFKPGCFFNQLEPAARKDWQAMMSCQKFSNGDFIYKEKDIPRGIFIVCKGRVKVYGADYTGQQMITWIRHPGEMFGHLAMFSGKDYGCNAESMGETLISFIATKDFYRLLDRYPGVSLLMLKKMAVENMNMQLKLKDTAYKPAKSRVAHTLIKHISFKTKDTNNPTIYGLKRTEIAEITGLALETVVRILADLEKKNIIKRSPTYIKILDYPALLKISNQQK